MNDDQAQPENRTPDAGYSAHIDHFDDILRGMGAQVSRDVSETDVKAVCNMHPYLELMATDDTRSRRVA